MLAARFADGSLLLAIVALIALEAAALVWLWYRRGTGLAPREYLGNLVSGGLLMMAVRAALIVAPTERRARSTMPSDQGKPISRCCAGLSLP